MTQSGESALKYSRSRFTARLPLDCLYTPAHFWARHAEDPGTDRREGLWQIGFTRFAKRMLGQVVELDFEVEPGAHVVLGQIVGWVEAFKAVSDLYCVAEGRFEGPNPRLSQEPDLVDEDPHGAGWLYGVRGTPDPKCVDAHGYVAILDAQIDKMLGERDGA